ncbi:MAG: solute-binding protein [Lachnospiraceae bacterium]
MKTQKAALSAGLFVLRVAIVAVIAAGIWWLGEYAYTYGYSIVSDAAMEPKPGRDMRVVLSGDMTVKETAQLLERRGLIADADIFRIQLKVNRYEERLRPGEYILNTSMTPEELMQVLSGESEEEDEEE